MYRALDIIHEEHRAVGAMLSGLRSLVANIEAKHLKPDFELMDSMICYIEEVPEKVHHPKEDQYLFARLREKSEEALPIIEALEDEHRQGGDRIRILRDALDVYRQNGERGFTAFKDAIKTYLDQEWHHMNMEESMIFPLAKAHLTAEDWAQIDEAFMSNANPWEGMEAQYVALFTRIVNATPAPIGLGGA